MSVITRDAPGSAVAPPSKRLDAGVSGAVVMWATIALGAATAALVGLDGSPRWQALRVAAIAALTVLAATYERRTTPRRRAVVALVLGIAGMVPGSAVGVIHVVKVAPASTAGLVALVAGLLLVGLGTTELVRAARGWRRWLAVPIGIGVIVFGFYPLIPAVYATNVPATELGRATPADRGLAYEDAEFATADGLVLSGWYIPSSNGAAVVLLHGSGSTRSNVLDHAAVLADEGFGVLLFDARGHGRSEGRAMDFGWYGDLDATAAVSYVDGRTDVETGRIAVVGMSMGGEEAIGAAAADERIRAVVAEGATGRVAGDRGWLPRHVPGWVQRGTDRIQDAATDLLTDIGPPIELRRAVAAAAPRPVLLIAAGSVPTELDAGNYIKSGSPETVELWEVPETGHTDALATHPDEWVARVSEFLDAALA